MSEELKGQAPSAEITASQDLMPEFTVTQVGQHYVETGRFLAAQINAKNLDPNTAADPALKESLNHQMGALRACDQAQDPSLKDRCKYNPATGDYIFRTFGDQGQDKLVSGKLTLQDTYASLKYLDRDGVPADIRTQAKERLATLRKHTGVSLETGGNKTTMSLEAYEKGLEEGSIDKNSPVKYGLNGNPEQAAAPAARVEALKNELTSEQLKASIIEMFGIKPDKVPGFQALWKQWYEEAGESSINTKDFLNALNEIQTKPSTRGEWLERIQEARSLYKQLFNKDAPPGADLPALQNAIFREISNDPIQWNELMSKKAGEIMKLFGGNGNAFLQILLVLGSAMTSFATTATEAAK